MKDHTANPFRSNAHLTYKQTRERPNRAFSYLGEDVACHKCHELIKIGNSARYDEFGNLHHTVHSNIDKRTKQPKLKPEVVCDRCWLVQPCECDD